MPDCFVIMPITTPEAMVPKYGDDKNHFAHVLDHLFVPAIEKAGFKPIPPSAEGSDLIHASIIKNIEKADLVLCDMSCLNPNVFFELGIRTALDRPVCMIQDDVSPRVPFDTAIINYHTYASALAPWELEGEVAKLADHVTKSMPGGEPNNALWSYFGISARAHALGDSKPTSEGSHDYLALQVDAIREQLARMEGATTPEVEYAINNVRLSGNNIMAVRHMNGMDRRALAEALGLPRAEIIKMEEGKPLVSLQQASDLADALRVPLIDILHR